MISCSTNAVTLICSAGGEMKLNYLLLFCLCASLVGCGIKKSYLIDKFDYNEAFFSNILIQSISIDDTRAETTSRVIKIPTLSWPGKQDTVKPELTQEQKELIKEEIFKHVGGQGKKVHVTATVTRGEQTFSTNWSGEHEYARFAIKINFTDGYSYQQASGDAFLQIRSMDASKEYIEQLYRKVIREAVHKCFMELKEL